MASSGPAALAGLRWLGWRLWWLGRFGKVWGNSRLVGGVWIQVLLDWLCFESQEPGKMLQTFMKEKKKCFYGLHGV